MKGASPMPGIDSPGFILVDSDLEPIVFNSAALQILAYPTVIDQIQQQNTFLKDKVRARLLQVNGDGKVKCGREYRSGIRRYQVRAFRCGPREEEDKRHCIAILLERQVSFKSFIDETLGPFHLTPREMQTVMLLVEGLTSKEIAGRLNISTNTVKAFLRLVMVKMNVSTRSGIVGRIVGQPVSAGRDDLWN
jgi:DNA-binding CsgD family transcriptional regulator